MNAYEFDFLEFVNQNLTGSLYHRIISFAEWTGSELLAAVVAHQIVLAKVALEGEGPQSLADALVVENNVVADCALQFIFNQLSVKLVPIAYGRPVD